MILLQNLFSFCNLSFILKLGFNTSYFEMQFRTVVCLQDLAISTVRQIIRNKCKTSVKYTNMQERGEKKQKHALYTDN